MSCLYYAAVVAAAVAGFASVASAADLPTKAPVYTAAPVAVYNWNGCYVGAHAGGGWARTEFTNTADTTAFGHLNPGEGFTYTYDGFIGGGQVGCNYQINQWVLGVEGTFAGTTIKGDAADLAVLNDDVFSTKINSLATVTARIGYAWNNVLLYAKGGYAGANVQFSVSDTCCVGGSPMGAGSDTHWQSGWTIGTGLNTGSRPIGSSVQSTTTSIWERRTTKSAAARAATPSTLRFVSKRCLHVLATSSAPNTQNKFELIKPRVVPGVFLFEQVKLF